MNQQKPEHLMPIPLDRCQHIRCKGMLVYGDDYLTHVDEAQRSHDFYCLHTQTVLGPDSALVTLSQCVKGRECFEVL